MSDKRLLMDVLTMQVTFKWKFLGQECRNVFYLVVADGDPDTFVWDDTQAQIAGINLTSQYWDAYGGLTAHDAQFYGADYVANTVSGVGPLIGGPINDTGFPYNGGEPGDGCANNVSLAIKLSTHLLGRSNHGRFYFVGINSGLYNATDPNELKAGSLTDFNTANTNFLSNTTSVAVTGGHASLGVCSFVSGGSDRSVAICNPVANISLTDSTFDSQRRRLPGRGI